MAFGIDDVLLGTVIGGGLSFLGGERRNEAAEAQSAQQMAFQERMSNTAHQREVADLKAAGINPMLSAKLGGASTPSGSMAQIEDSITPAVNTGMAAARTRADLELIKAQVRKADAETAEASERTMGYAYDRAIKVQEEDLLKKRVPGEHYRSETAGEEFNRLYDLRRSLGVREGGALARQLGSDNLIRDPVIAKYLMELPGLRSEMRLRGSLSTLHELEAPRARNEAAAQSSWWKSRIAPYLHDASSSIGTGARAYWMLGR